MLRTDTRLMELVDELADTPTLSVYMSTDSTPRRGGTHGVWQTEIADVVRELRLRYGHDGHARGGRDVFERNLRRLELRLRGLPHAMRSSGWFVVVARGDVHYSAPAPRPLDGRSDGRWQYGPWIPLRLGPTAIASQERPFLPTAAEYQTHDLTGA